MKQMSITKRDGRTHVVRYDEADTGIIEQHQWFIKPSATSNELFYACTFIPKPGGGRSLLHMHKLVMGRAWVDHINHDGLDNRRENLRLVTPTQNAANQRKAPGCSSPYKGVNWNKREQKWIARIGCGERKFLGYFTDELDAARAYNVAAAALFGEFALLNPVDTPVDYDRAPREVSPRLPKTHCPHGHPKTPENRLASGYCRPCNVKAQAAYKARLKETRQP